MSFLVQKIQKDSYNTSIRPTKAAYVIAGAIALVLFFLTFCVRSVGAGQVGIVTRFGEVNRVAESGIAIKLPWPLERLEKMETRVQKEEQTATAATSDLQDVNATLALNYALDNETALRVYKELGKDYKNRVVVPAVQESFKASTAGYTASQLIIERSAIKNKAYDVIKERLNKYGIRVVDLNIVNFGFSPQFTAALEAKQVAAQEAEKAKYEVEKARNLGQAGIEGARAAKEANELLNQGLTDQILANKALDKWNGVLPTTYAGDGETVFNIPLR